MKSVDTFGAAMTKEEYELVPLDPIRSLEKKVEKLEASVSGKSVNQEFVDLIKTNQQVVDDLVKMSVDVTNRIVHLSESIENLVGKLSEFMNKFEILGVEIESEKAGGERVKSLEEENKKLKEFQEDLIDKLSKLEKKVNTLVLSRVPIRRPIRSMTPISP